MSLENTFLLAKRWRKKIFNFVKNEKKLLIKLLFELKNVFININSCPITYILMQNLFKKLFIF